MKYIKQLAGQTVVYGLGIVIPRILNYILLTPFYTRVFTKAEYGIITELYAYVVFLLVILTYGMETGFFRFSEGKQKDNVYKTALFSLAFSSTIFVIVIYVLKDRICQIIGYENRVQYIVWVGIIVAIDAFTSIPFARIRFYNRAKRYAIIRIIEVFTNLFFNWFFIIYCHNNYESKQFIQGIYNPDYRVGYVLLSNLIASLTKLILLSPEIFIKKGKFLFETLKKLLKYSYPLLIAGLAGTINEAIDRILIKYRIPEGSNPMEQLGIYGANFKLAVMMTLFIQMFRYAAEPFFFSKKNEINAKEIYADVLSYFVFFCSLIFLLVTYYMDIFKLFIGTEFREGLYIVPIILMANLFVGIFYNLSIWYKITNKTKYGAVIVITGAVVTFIINYFFIPVYGYYASAWGHFISYLVMIIISYGLGQKYYRIPYNVKEVFFYILASSMLFIGLKYIENNGISVSYGMKTVIIFLYSLFFIIRKGLLKEIFQRK